MRSRSGSIGTRGYSVRTGIPGLYFRGSWKKGRSGRRSTSGLGSVFALIAFPFQLIVALFHVGVLVIKLFVEFCETVSTAAEWVTAKVAHIRASSKVQVIKELPSQEQEVSCQLPSPRQAPGQTTFAYVARDWSGNRVSGRIGAADKMDAMRQLDKLRVVPISLETLEI